MIESEIIPIEADNNYNYTYRTSSSALNNPTTYYFWDLIPNTACSVALYLNPIVYSLFGLPKYRIPTKSHE